MTKLCFEFMVLTAARSGEARVTTWDEMDLRRRVWAIPAARMKASYEHRVPLSAKAPMLLNEAKDSADDSGLLFPSPRGKPLPDSTRNCGLFGRGQPEDGAGTQGLSSHFGRRLAELRCWGCASANSSCTTRFGKVFRQYPPLNGLDTGYHETRVNNLGSHVWVSLTFMCESTMHR